MRKQLFILFFFVALAGCRNNEVPLPMGYLTQEEMLPIMVDIHLIEGARSGTLVLGDTNSLPDYYAKIYQKHNINEAKFKESFAWYTKNPEKLKLVYEAVIVELSKKEAEIVSYKKLNDAVADTIVQEVADTNKKLLRNILKK